MVSVIIKFRVEQIHLSKAETIIKKFIANVLNNEPDTLLYKSFQMMEEPEKFIHVMTFKDEKAQEVHRNSDYCKNSLEELYPMCNDLPKASLLNEIS